MGYTISEILCEMISDQHFSNLVTHKKPNSEIAQWHAIVFFSQKKIYVETCYKTHNQEFLTIVRVFKTFEYYLVLLKKLLIQGLDLYGP